MGNTFGQNFLLGYTAARRAQDEKQRQEMERQHLALERQRVTAAIAAQEATAKSQEIEAQQQDLLMQLKLAESRDQPTTAVSPEAGGVGPPAPAAREQFTAPLHGGGTLTAPAQYRGDVQQRAAEAIQTEGHAKMGLRQEEAALPVPMTDGGRAAIGLPPGVQATEADVKAFTEKFKEAHADRRASMAAAAAAAKADKPKWTPDVDEMGNFTGKSYNTQTGEVREMPGLAGLRGKPLTGYAASRIHQAHVINDAGDQLISSIEAVAPKLGPLMGREFKLEKLWGSPDPDIAQFAAELESFAALQPALHGFRGQSALAEFSKLIGGTVQTPEALAASIRGILRTSNIVSNSGKLKAPGSNVEDLRKKYGY